MQLILKDGNTIGVCVYIYICTDGPTVDIYLCAPIDCYLAWWVIGWLFIVCGVCPYRYCIVMDAFMSICGVLLYHYSIH